MKKLLILSLLLSLFLVSCGAGRSSALQASGLIEATEIAVAPELSGRVVEVLAEEGNPVKSGDPLLSLDDSLLLAEKQNAEAGLESAAAAVQSAKISLELAQLQYDQTLSAALASDQGNRVADWRTLPPDAFDQPAWYFTQSERIGAAQADVETAKTALEEVRTNLASVSKEVGSADFLEAETKLAEARAAFLSAREVNSRSQALSDSKMTDAEKNDYNRLKDAASNAYDQARDALNSAQNAYDELLDTQAARDVLKARAELSVAQEKYFAALDGLRTLQTGVNSPAVSMAAKTVEQASSGLEQAKANLAQVRTQLLLIETQMEKLVVYAPTDGVLLTRSVQPGEVIQAGLSVMTIAQLDTLTVTVYIPEDRYGEVSLGNTATLMVDSFPDETFEAAVTRIANKAEYTPRNVQTKEERQTTVYAVELKANNPDGKLKPGMPVDVTFESAGN